MTGREMYAELVNLRNQAGQNIYQRLKIADQLLSNKDWVEDETQGGGDISKACDRLEQDCFADLCGVLSLPQMLEIYKHYKSEKTWRDNKYNLRKMYWAMKEVQKPSKQNKQEPTNPPSDDPLVSLRKENKELRQQVSELQRENKRLRTTLQQMREQINKLGITV